MPVALRDDRWSGHRARSVVLSKSINANLRVAICTRIGREDETWRRGVLITLTDWGWYAVVSQAVRRVFWLVSGRHSVRPCGRVRAG